MLYTHHAFLYNGIEYLISKSYMLVLCSKEIVYLLLKSFPPLSTIDNLNPGMLELRNCSLLLGICGCWRA